MSSISIVGRGRLGTALSAALRAAGRRVDGPLGRGAAAPDAGVVLLCVPDAEIAAAAQALGAPIAGRLVGHCSGATTLDVLHPHEAFSLHPLMTVPDAAATIAGAGCAIAAASPAALAAAHDLASSLELRPYEIAEADRAAYHAAASMASNFLVTLEGAAERLLATARADRELLVPLVRASVESWATHGAARALTGPIARGDEETVTRQRAAVERRTPELLGLFDVLADATRDLARAAA